MNRKTMTLSVVGLLSACASTSITPIANNQFLLSTSAAPVCGASGSAKVATKMASIETLRRGYIRFVVVGAGSQNNVKVVDSGPTYATTNSSASVYGNNIYGQSTTTFGGGGPVIFGTNDTKLNILMLNPGDRGFENAVDARAELGPNWKEQAASGVATCT